MSSGQLRHRITIQECVAGVNPRGFSTNTWQDVCTVWAGVENLRGREFFAAAAVQAEHTVKFIIRYRSGLDPSMRIFFNGNQYNITGIDYQLYRKRYLEVRAMEVKHNGN